MIWRRLMLAVSGFEQLPSHVLDRVGRIARGLDAHVELFHCLYEPEAVQDAGGEHAAQVIAARVEERRRRLERLADALRDQGLRVDASVRWDYPTHEAIIRHSLRYKPDLLIVPAFRLDETQRTLAYRASRLIAECPSPVLFAKTREVYSGRSIVAAIAQPDHEAADLDERILGAARTMAHALAESPVCVFSVAEAEDRIRPLALRHDVSSQDVHVEHGEPAAALGAYARKVRAQMIVLGVRAEAPCESSSDHLARRVLDNVECDLLVVKSPDQPVTVDSEAAPAVPHPG